MTQTSRPWQSTTPGDAGPYSSDNWSSLQRYIAGGDSINVESGPITGSGTAPDPGLTVTQRGAGANMSIDVSLGAALVNGTFYLNDATVNLVIAANASGNPRIDTIVLNKDWSAQTIRLLVVQGTPAGSPTPPSLVQTAGVQWQIPLADVAVANGAVSITTANITSRKAAANVSDGVYLQGVLNNSGAVLVDGDVVVWDTTTNRAVTTTTTAGNGAVAGVWRGRSAIGAYGRVQVKGIGYINMSGAVATRGVGVYHSGTAKQATVMLATAVGVSGFNSFAMTLETTGGAGFCLCYIDVMTGKLVQAATAFVVRNQGANYTSTSTTFVDVDAANLILTMNIYGGKAMIIAQFDTVVDGSGNSEEFDIILDSATRAGDATHGLVRFSNANARMMLTIVAIFTGLTPGSHTFKLQYRVTPAGTVTIEGNPGAGLGSAGSLVTMGGWGQ